VAIFAGIFGMLGRFAGKLLTTALGWASSLLFGRVPRSRQMFVVAIMAGSAVWLVLVIGVALPAIGAFLLAAAPIPPAVDSGWVSLAMLIGALTLPILIGVLAWMVPEASLRPKGTAAIRQVARGYPLALVLSVVMVFLPLVALVRRLRSLGRRWSDVHVPVVAKLGGYDRTVHDLAAALAGAGLHVEPRRAPSVLAIPGELVARVGGGGVRALLPDHLIELRGPRLEVGIYPSDITISGPKPERILARAAILSRLATTSAHLTTSAEAQAVEDRLERLARHSAGEPGAIGAIEQELGSIDDVLAHLDVAADEWDVLYRIRLQVERDLLVRAFGVASSDVSAPQGRAAPPARAERAASPSEYLVAAGAVILMALDVALAFLPPRRRRRPKG
jgi:hypothetical protein